MAKQINVGIGGVVKTVKSVYTGIGGVVKTVKSGKCGIGGVVKEFFASEYVLYEEGNNVVNFSSHYNTNVEFYTDAILIESYKKMAVIKSSSAVDFSKYNELHINMRGYNLTYGYVNIYMDVTNGGGASISTATITNDYVYRDYVIDISDVTDNNTFNLAFYNVNPSGSRGDFGVWIKKIWLT